MICPRCGADRPDEVHLDWCDYDGPEPTDAEDDSGGQWPCPHCGSLDVDRGFTGLDLCNRCGGLSRGGRRLHEDQA